MSNKEYHYTYYSYEEWGMGYFGVRSCDCLPEEDIEYFGSFTHKNFHPTYKIILQSDYPTRVDAMKDEILLHDHYNVAANPHFANRAKQTSTRFTQAGVSPSTETRNKLSKAGKGKKRSEETKQKMSKAFSGKYVSEETREKFRLANIGKKLSPETIKKREDTRRRNYANGPKRFLSEESKKRISESVKKLPSTIFINDGFVSKRIERNVPIPEGWIRGRLPRNSSSTNRRTRSINI
jgi:hypothetical protein